MNAMKGLGLENADASPDNFISMMQGMMANLLSKDLLYPSLKEIQMRVSTSAFLFCRKLAMLKTVVSYYQLCFWFLLSCGSFPVC